MQDHDQYLVQLPIALPPVEQPRQLDQGESEALLFPLSSLPLLLVTGVGEEGEAAVYCQGAALDHRSGEEGGRGQA